MILIFSFSAQEATQSVDTSNSFLEKVIAVFYSDFPSLDDAKQEEIISSVKPFIRPAAHFAVFGGLGFFAFLSIVTYRKIKFSNRVIYSLCFCLLYALSDEIHQIFVDGRAFEMIDIVLDFTGSSLAITFVALLSRYIKQIYKHII